MDKKVFISGKSMSYYDLYKITYDQKDLDKYYINIYEKLKGDTQVIDPVSDARYIFSKLYISSIDLHLETFYKVYVVKEYIDNMSLKQVRKIISETFFLVLDIIYKNMIVSFIRDYLENYDRFNICLVDTPELDIGDIESPVEIIRSYESNKYLSAITINSVFKSWETLKSAKENNIYLFKKIDKPLPASFNRRVLNSLQYNVYDFSNLTVKQIAFMIYNRWVMYIDWTRLQLTFDQKMLQVSIGYDNERIEKINIFLEQMLLDPINSNYLLESEKTIWFEKHKGSNIDIFFRRVQKLPYCLRAELVKNLELNIKLEKSNKSYSVFNTTNIESAKQKIKNYWIPKLRFLDLMLYEYMTGYSINEKHNYIQEKESSDDEREINSSRYKKYIEEIFHFDYLKDLMTVCLFDS
ncbi:hypothetical protein [Francisella uliginis]|uniref:hypothetical protein n=1 Tax=Francisella uliginis TaxID=573570 RepID=UPI0011AB6DEB|nr:hypothetical protein [Francisella uliginis]